MASDEERNRRAARGRKPSRHITPKGVEAEFEPHSHGRVLRNRLHLYRKAEMDRMEFEALVTAQEKYLSQTGSHTCLTAEMLCRMHRDWLGDIYEWAGRYRTVELAKGDFRWPPAFRVSQNMDAFEKGLRARLRSLDSFLRGGFGTSLARASEGLSGDTPCSLKNRGLAGIIVEHRPAVRRIGHVRIALEQRFHNTDYTSSGGKKKRYSFTLVLSVVAQG